MSDCPKLIIGQYKNSPALVKIIDSFCDTVQVDLIDPADQLILEAAVSTASGFYLDLIGERVNLKRPGIPASESNVFGFEGQADAQTFDQGRFAEQGEDVNYIPVTDDVYRGFLIARGGELLTDGSQPNLSKVAASAYGGALYIDNQDMSLSVILSGVTSEVAGLISQLGLIPKPAGVRINSLEFVHPEGAFGFEGQDDSVGFDQAPFTGVI